MPNCIVQGCPKQQKSKGLCLAHYLRNKRYGNPLGNTCKIQGCVCPVHIKQLCKLHYAQQWRLNSAVDQDGSIESLLEKAQAAYVLATGVQNRIQWRKKICELESYLNTGLEQLKKKTTWFRLQTDALEPQIKMGTFVRPVVCSPSQLAIGDCVQVRLHGQTNAHLTVLDMASTDADFLIFRTPGRQERVYACEIAEVAKLKIVNKRS